MIYAICAMMGLINAWIDYKVILSGNSPNHTLEACIRGTVILLVAILIYDTWPMRILGFITGAAVFWLKFEMMLNLLRNRPLFYVGYTAKTDLFIRSIFPGKPETALFIIKITILIASICLMALFGQE